MPLRLVQDDLEALHVLYPDCTHAVTTPVCFKLQHNIGWVRLGSYIGLPAVVALVITLLLNGCVRKHQLHRLRSAHNLVAVKDRDLNSARGHAQKHLHRASILQV